jgi:outer membrane receptor protein involved in Fe transport
MDKFDNIDDAVWSPRTTLMIKPRPEHTFRVSYNKAFRSPSLINNFLQTAIIDELDLGALNPALAGRIYRFPVSAVGNEDLVEQELNAFEIGYTGVINQRVNVTAAWYFNDMQDDIFFTQVGSYRATNPPPGWPLPPIVLEAIRLSGRFGPGNGLPSVFSYRNLGNVETKGLELGMDTPLNQNLTAFANYSYQTDPETDFPEDEANRPPNHRFNVGFNGDYGRYFGNVAISYVSEAFWQDVLDARFSGTTDDYTLVNLGFGVKWGGDRATTSVKIVNLFDQEIQQHIFGDIMKRQVVGEVRVGF